MSFKRVPVNYWQRLWAGRRAGGGVALGIFAVCGTIATVYSGAGNVINPNLAIVAVVGPLVGGVVAAFIRGQMKAFPDSIVADFEADVPYKCAYCTAEHLEEACEMTRPYYGGEYVAGRVAEHWRTANPKGFVEIVNRNGELCACFGVLALTDSFREQFLKGRVSDTQMGADCILNAEESRSACHLYISGVVVRSPESYAGRKRAWVMFWAILNYLKKTYGVRKERTLFAIAANRESEQLMKNLGFALQCEARQRSDKCPLYTYELTKEGLKRLMDRVGDLSSMCECNF